MNYNIPISIIQWQAKKWRAEGARSLSNERYGQYLYNDIL